MQPKRRQVGALQSGAQFNYPLIRAVAAPAAAAVAAALEVTSGKNHGGAFGVVVASFSQDSFEQCDIYGLSESRRRRRVEEFGMNQPREQFRSFNYTRAGTCEE